MTVSNKDDLSLTKFGKAESAQGLHMHKDIFRSFTAREKTKSAYPIKPLDDCLFKVTLRYHMNVRSLWQLRRMNSCTFIHFDDSESLQSPWPSQNLANNASPLVSRLVTIPPQTCHMKENIRQPIVGNNKTITFRSIKPFDGTGNFKDINRRFITNILYAQKVF